MHLRAANTLCNAGSSVGVSAVNMIREMKMRRVELAANDIALALRLNGVKSDEVSAALSGAELQTEEIPSALAYVGYKR